MANELDYEKIAELTGVTEDEAREFIHADWPNAGEHAEWVRTATAEEIADWIVAGK